MDEVQEFCRRVLGAGTTSEQAAIETRSVAPSGRIASLSAAARICRAYAQRQDAQAAPPPRTGSAGAEGGDPAGLAAAVAAELAAATASLPERQREALALRELLALSYDEVAEVMEVEPVAVPPLLARARLRLRVARRGTEIDIGPPCPERDRSLRLLACRQDGETLSAEDEDWLSEHLGGCPGCEVAHAAMLEASVCYRAWPSGPVPDLDAAPAPGQ